MNAAAQVAQAGMNKPVRFNAFQMNTPSHQSPGLWRHPRSDAGSYRDAAY